MVVYKHVFDHELPSDYHLKRSEASNGYYQ